MINNHLRLFILTIIDLGFEAKLKGENHVNIYILKGKLDK